MPNLAPLIAAVRRRPAHWMFGSPSRLPAASLPDGGTGDVIGLKVEIAFGGTWTDVSSYVRYQNRVKITRGRPDETSSAQPQTCTFTLDNRDGRFSPRNPVGPYYGQIGRNTPVRVSRLNNGVRRYRYYGEIPAWPMVSDITGNEVTVTVQAAGMLRRLNQGATPLRSALFRAYTLGYNSNQFNAFTSAPLKPVAYWPCEDGTSSTSIASGLAGGTPMVLSGQALPTFASNTVFASSAALPLLAASIWTGAVPSYTGGTANVLRFLMSVPATGAFDTGVVGRMYTAGTVARLDVAYSAGSGGSLVLTGYDVSNNSLFTTTLTLTVGSVTGINNVPIMVSAELTVSGGSVVYQIAAVTPSGSASFGIGGSVSGSLGNATQVVINPDGHLNDTAIGHVTFQSGYDVLNNVQAALGAYNNDSPIIRFGRLCGEQNVASVNLFVTGNTLIGSDPTAMGVQAIDTFPNLIQQCADALYVPIFEARDQMSLVMRSKGTMYNQAARLTLDMSAHQLSGPLIPVDDDALTRNDVTVSATSGSSAQVVQTAAPLSALPFPAGVGDYATTYSLNLSAATSLSNQAGWRMRFGTVDEPRYPQVPINLRHGTFTSSVDLMNAALTIDLGDRLVINNPPAPDYPPDPISLILQGYTETLGIFEHDMVLNCSPESPWRIGILDDTVLGVLDTDGSTLALPITSSATTLTVTTTGFPASPSWTTNAADFPFDISVGGERMTVTGIGTMPMVMPVDGTFESGVASWQKLDVTLVQSSAQAHSGTFSGLMTVSASTPPAWIRSPSIDVVGNAPYLVSAWVLLASGSPVVVVAVDWYDATSTFISSVASSSVTSPVSWTNVAATFTTPPNAAHGLPSVALLGSPGLGTAIYVDDVTFSQYSPQPFTVTRSVNGVVKTQTAGTDVRLWQPMYLSL